MFLKFAIFVLKFHIMQKLELKSKSINALDIPIDVNGFKGLVISDLHIGYVHNKIDSMNYLMKRLHKLVKAVKPTHLFILGDIIHIGLFNLPSQFNAFFRRLEQLKIPVHIIPGNHERYVKSFVDFFSIKSEMVFFHNYELMRIIPSNNTRMVVMGHDVKNDLKVHGKRLVREWYNLLRTEFSELIPENALMILGHLHERVISQDKLTISIFPYSVDYESFQYGILEPDDQGVIVFNTYFQDQK